MAPFEYLLLFASVILGLAACELAIGVNRLLGAWSRVKWDWLTPLAATLVFLKLVTQWWSWHGAVALASGITFEMYLAILVGSVLLFMLAAAALPNEAGGETSIELRTHYERVRRRFWIVFTLHFIVNMGIVLWLQIAMHPGAIVPWYAWLVWLMVPLSLSLAILRNRIWHTIALVGLCLLYLFQFWGQTLPS